jgi:hypothetical protein
MLRAALRVCSTTIFSDSKLHSGRDHMQLEKNVSSLECHWLTGASKAGARCSEHCEWVLTIEHLPFSVLPLSPISQLCFSK